MVKDVTTEGEEFVVSSKDVEEFPEEANDSKLKKLMEVIHQWVAKLI